MKRLLVPSALLLSLTLAGCGAATARPDPEATQAQERLSEFVNDQLGQSPGYLGTMASTGVDADSGESESMGVLGFDAEHRSVSVHAVCEETTGAKLTAKLRVNDGAPVDLHCAPNGGLEVVAEGIAPEADGVRVTFGDLPDTAAWAFAVVADGEEGGASAE